MKKLDANEIGYPHHRAVVNRIVVADDFEVAVLITSDNLLCCGLTGSTIRGEIVRIDGWMPERQPERGCEKRRAKK